MSNDKEVEEFLQKIDDYELDMANEEPDESAEHYEQLWMEERSRQRYPAIIQRMIEAGIDMPLEPGEDPEGVDTALREQSERLLEKYNIKSVEEQSRLNKICSRLNNELEQGIIDIQFHLLVEGIAEQIARDRVYESWEARRKVESQRDKMRILRRLESIVAAQEPDNDVYPEDDIDWYAELIYKDVMDSSERGFNLTEEEKAAVINLTAEISGIPFDLESYLQDQADQRELIEKDRHEIEKSRHQATIANKIVVSILGNDYEMHDDWGSLLTQAKEFRVRSFHKALREFEAEFGPQPNITKEELLQAGVDMYDNLYVYLAVDSIRAIRNISSRIGIPTESVNDLIEQLRSA